jgi:hypothetical protein
MLGLKLKPDRVNGIHVSQEMDYSSGGARIEV